MTREEAGARFAAAVARLAKASPEAAIMAVALITIATLFHAVAHLCVGFGTAALLHVSGWWGMPIALLSGQTLGRAWAWTQRDGRVLRMERAADEAERRAAENPPGRRP